MRIFREIINSLIKLVAITIPLATAIAVIFNQVQIRKTFYESVQEVIATQSDIEQSISFKGTEESIYALAENRNNATIDLLIGLFGIVIAVWVGLNIYNVMKKDDYNELLKTITEKCTEHDYIQKKVEETYSENMEMHLSYLLKTFDINNNSSQYFYSLFSEINNKNLDYKFLLNATFLETIYVKLTTIHKNNEHIKMEPYIAEGNRRCKEMLSWIDKNGDTVENTNRLLGYITYRQGRMDFYQGMMQYYAFSNNNDASACFMSAAKKFRKALAFDDQISRNINIYNTLGYIYIKIYEWNVNRLEPLYNSQKMDEIINNALEYCKKSMHDTATSLKNLGIAYEKLGNFKLAIQKYKEAVEKDPRDYQSRICLASAYLKNVQTVLKITTKRDKLLCEMVFSSKEKSKALLLIKKASVELEIAQVIDEHSANYYYKKGQLLTYCYLLEKDKNMKKIYRKEAKNALLFLTIYILLMMHIDFMKEIIMKQ